MQIEQETIRTVRRTPLAAPLPLQRMTELSMRDKGDRQCYCDDDHRSERADVVATRDPSIVPIGMPLIAGPGAISTVMVLVGQARDGGHRTALAIAIAANILLTLVMLLAAPWIVSRIGETGQRIISKIMGLITAVIGVQFVLNGVESVALSILKASRP